MTGLGSAETGTATTGTATTTPPAQPVRQRAARQGPQFLQPWLHRPPLYRHQRPQHPRDHQLPQRYTPPHALTAPRVRSSNAFSFQSTPTATPTAEVRIATLRPHSFNADVACRPTWLLLRRVLQQRKPIQEARQLTPVARRMWALCHCLLRHQTQATQRSLGSRGSGGVSVTSTASGHRNLA